MNGEFSILTRPPLKRFARSLKNTLKNKATDADYENEIRAELAALLKSLGEYSKARTDSLQGSAADFTEETLDDLRRKAIRSGQKVPRFA